MWQALFFQTVYYTLNLIWADFTKLKEVGYRLIFRGNSSVELKELEIPRPIDAKN